LLLSELFDCLFRIPTRRTYGLLQPEPRQNRRLAVCTHVNTWLLRPHLCSQQADRAHGNATATANNIAAFETRFRLGIACNLIGQAGFIYVALALYDLLKGVNQRHALLMVTLIVVSIPIAFLNELNAIAALVLVRGAGFLSIFEKPQRDALAMLFLNLHSHGFDVAAIFWGLWLFPLGLLVYRSGFLPRVLGVLLMLNGFTYPVNSLTSLLLPQHEHIVSR
jgi:hypothetical protein